MLKVDGLTIGEAFEQAVAAWPTNEFMVVPRDVERRYDPEGWSCTYAEASHYVNVYAASLRDAGYGVGHRIAVLLENRPDMLLWKLACHKVGASWVPINPDYRSAEAAYVLADCDAALVIVAAGHADLIEAASGPPGPGQEPVKAFLRATFATRTRAEWEAFFAAHDVCAAVLGPIPFWLESA